MIKSDNGKVEIKGNIMDVNFDLICILSELDNEGFEILKKYTNKDKPEIDVFINSIQQAIVQAKIIDNKLKEI